MATKIEAFTDAPRRSKYPLDDWLDGGIWRLARGEDFEQSTTSMRSVLYTAAKRRGGSVMTRTIRDGDSEVLEVQFLAANGKAKK